MNDLQSLIQSRRSIRRYETRSVPNDLLDQVLHAAIWSPSAHNRQPWRFAVIETEDVKVQLARAMGSRLRADLERDAVPEPIIEQDIARSYERLTTAPVFVVVCTSMVDMDVYRDKERNTNEYLMAVQSTAMAGQNMLLMAHSLGLGACWLCAPLFCGDVVREVLGLPSDWQPQGLITLGYPAQSRTKTRRSLNEVVTWR